MTLPQGQIERYTFRERIVHALAAISYVYLLLTGLAFWTPALFWMAVALGGGFLSRALHPWVGVFFALVVARLFVMWRREMRTTDADREWRRAIRHYIRNEDDRVPDAGRFNFGQKQMFWVMAWGALLLLISGLVLWFPEAVPAAAGGVRAAAVLTHAVAALAMIAAFIVHLYMGLIVVPGGTRAIIRGDVSEEWASHHHREWADSVRPRRPER